METLERVYFHHHPDFQKSAVSSLFAPASLPLQRLHVHSEGASRLALSNEAGVLWALKAFEGTARLKFHVSIVPILKIMQWPERSCALTLTAKLLEG